MVKHVGITFVKDTPLNGMLLVADVDFSVGIQEFINMRVVVIIAESTVVDFKETRFQDFQRPPQDITARRDSAHGKYENAMCRCFWRPYDAQSSNT